MFVNHRNMIGLQNKLALALVSIESTTRVIMPYICLDLFQWGQILSEVVFQSLKTLSQIYFGIFNVLLTIVIKVENILKGSLDSIPSPSPSVKIQIIGGKVYLR